MCHGTARNANVMEPKGEKIRGHASSLGAWQGGHGPGQEESWFSVPNHNAVDTFNPKSL